jgi:imidazolonepropionase-like amidohydrolase
MFRGSSLALLACCAATFATPAAAQVTAFVDVTIISAYGQPHVDHQTVVVRDGRIAAVGSAATLRVPRDARIIAGHGRVLAPGLADMHVHIFEPNDGVLFLANGVTSVRNMRGRPETDTLAARIEEGTAPGPRIYSSGPIIDDATGQDAVQIRDRVNRTADAGYIAAKLYENLSPDQFAAGVGAARDRGLQVYAHVPLGMSVRDVLAQRIDSIEHLTGFDRALAPLSQSGWDQQRWTDVDAALIDPLAREVARSGVWNAATLITWLAPERAFADIDAAERAPLYRFATPRLRSHWRTLYDGYRREHDPAQAWALAEAGHRARLAVVRALYEAGAPLLIGTDATQPFMYPGYSLLDEIDLHHDAGIPASAILHAASADAARFLRRDGEFGVIAVGMRADLLLLDDDPETNLTTLRAPSGVMAAGRWYDSAALRRMLDDVAARIAAVVTAPN